MSKSKLTAFSQDNFVWFDPRAPEEVQGHVDLSDVGVSCEFGPSVFRCGVPDTVKVI